MRLLELKPFRILIGKGAAVHNPRPSIHKALETQCVAMNVPHGIGRARLAGIENHLDEARLGLPFENAVA